MVMMSFRLRQVGLALCLAASPWSVPRPRACVLIMKKGPGRAKPRVTVRTRARRKPRKERKTKPFLMLSVFVSSISLFRALAQSLKPKSSRSAKAFRIPTSLRPIPCRLPPGRSEQLRRSLIGTSHTRTFYDPFYPRARLRACKTINSNTIAHLFRWLCLLRVPGSLGDASR